MWMRSMLAYSADQNEHTESVGYLHSCRTASLPFTNNQLIYRFEKDIAAFENVACNNDCEEQSAKPQLASDANVEVYL